MSAIDEQYAAGMRISQPDFCWRLLGDGKCCIKNRGHDGGIHEPPYNVVFHLRRVKSYIDSTENSVLKALAYDSLAVVASAVRKEL